MSSDSEVKLELTPVSKEMILDEKTIQAYEIDPDSMIKSNNAFFKNSKIVVLNGMHFAEKTFRENRSEFKTLTPFRVDQKPYQQRRFSFGAYSITDFSLFLFFNGVAEATDKKKDSRMNAVLIYNKLKQYCSQKEQSLKPFAIKI